MPAEALPGGRCAVDAEGQRAMDALVTRIATAPSLVAVMDDAALNAAGAPHRFAVTRGLIAAAADGDELAGLLAWRLGGGGQPQPASASMLPVSATTGRAITARVAPYKAASDEPAAALLRAAGLRTDGLARFVERTRAKGSLPEYLSGYPAQAGARAQAGTGGRGAPAVTPAKWKALRGLCGAG